MMISNVRRIAQKELNLFFASPIAYLFLAVFLGITLFLFFWVESFFARNISDVRPMFEWMPILLILLSAALTMRMWSEERRSGTLEHIMTLPISPWHFVLGKFAACKILLLIALLLTLPLPITVAIFADLDWGPVISAYIATMFLGSAYLAIGLFISAKSDNQIVSLMLTVILCTIFYLVGSTTITDLAGNYAGEFLRSIGSGSRFESITRGVLDIRDLYYYISIVLLFLVLNRYSLEKRRWAEDGNTKHHMQWRSLSALLAVNALLANFWLAPIGSLRVDMTEGKMYSISDATRQYIAQLREPLIIQGFFSEKTHPLLAPLVPQLKDLLKEYQQEADGKIQLAFIDPAKNPEAEEEAGSKYGIKPEAFRVADRYQSSVVNSYFNLLVRYGDEYKVLSFRDLIEVGTTGSNDIEVKLRNPEYDVTNAIKAVLYDYQSGGNLFDSIRQSLDFVAYVSDKSKLPESLAEFLPKVKKVIAEQKDKSDGKLSVTYLDPDTAKNDQGQPIAQEIAENYGFQPMASSLFDTNTFYFYMLIAGEDAGVQIPLPDDLDEEGLKRSIEAALKRFAAGFTKTIGVVAPEQNPYAQQMGQAPGASFNAAQQVLNENMSTNSPDLSTGKVPQDTDLLMVMAPKDLDEKSVFAIDQFLMKGGTVVLATSPYNVEQGRTGISAQPSESGLGDWLKHHGLEVGNSLVMDQQNSSFPIPVTRNVGMFQVQEMVMTDYPYFIDIRGEGLNDDHPITSGLNELTVAWASPIKVNDEKNKERSLTTLIQSSPDTWLSSETKLTPQYSDDRTLSPFKPGQMLGSQKLAVVVEGKFESFFKGKDNPLLKKEDEEEESEEAKEEDEEEEKPDEVISSVIERSSESAKIVLLSSNNFAEDRSLRMMSSIQGNNYTAPAELLANIAEWSLEDAGLLSIRSRGHFNRTIPPLDESDRQFWEWLNYFLALAGVVLVYLYQLVQKKRKKSRFESVLFGDNAGESKDLGGAAA